MQVMLCRWFYNQYVMKRTAFISGLVFILGLTLSAQDNANKLEGSWSGNMKTAAGELQLVIHFAMTEADTVKASMDSPDQGVKGIPCGRVTLDDDTLMVDIPMVRGSFRGGFTNDSIITGRWTQLGREYDLSLKKGAKPIVYSRPQEPMPPYPYREEEVTFMNTVENFSLAGTLTLPQGEGPFPAVVLITGSGQQDRDETIFMHKPFKVLADHLTRNGIAVLRYDDRGVGGSKGRLTEATTMSFADDAEAAVNYLMQRAEIDKKKIGLAGHSEGGLIAPIVASRNANIAFVISLAGPGVTGYDAIIQQNIDFFTVSEMPQEDLETQLHMLRNLFTIVMDSKDQRTAAKRAMEWYNGELDTMGLAPEERAQRMTDFTQGLIQTNNAWWKYFLSADPALYWSNVQCPVLALNGEKDFQVNHKQNLPAIKNAVRRGGNRKVKTVALPGLNHLFQNAGTGLTTEYPKIEETFSPAAMDLITKWIRKTVKSGKRQ